MAELLARLANYERTRPNERAWDLATMRRLLAAPGMPPQVRPAVQVGGSKGKGTTSACLEALVRAAGIRTGLYSSPHLVTVCERIRYGDRFVDPAELAALLRRVLELPGLENTPTYFEALTAAAAMAFAEHGVEFAIYEVGLGGRHDATTALPVDASIITTIELEHTEVLGDTVAEIAAEKAAILRPGGVGYTAATGEALAVIRAHAEQVGARLHVLGEDLTHTEPECRSGTWRFRLRLPGGAEHPVSLADAARFEIPALALAVAAAAEVLPAARLRLDPAPRARLWARFEVLAEPDGEVLVLDGAHTEESMRAVAEEIRRRWPGERIAVLFAAAAGKRWREGLSVLLPLADSVVVTGLVDTASEDPAEVASWVASRGGSSVAVADVESGLAALRERPGPRLVVGSFYLAGRVRELVIDRQNRQE